jgi:FtsP/CotA-like multicopper oxidase with cupredoxin domain
MPTRKTLAILAMSITALLGFITLQNIHLPNAAFNVSLAQSCERPPGYVLMILDDGGFNDSIHRGQPTIEFQRGDTVNILVCNLDPVQSHGFAIDHYFATGVTLRPGEAYRVSFVTRDPGSFTIYCNVFCTVHTFMKGRLVVN